MSSEKSGSPGGQTRGGLALVGTIGGCVALCILVGLGVGLALDHFLRTSPWLLITGVVLGFIVSFYLVYRIAMGETG